MLQKNYQKHNDFYKYQFLAVKIATRYKNDNIDLQDLIQASYLGLITGLDKCIISDEKHKINYLSKYILGEIVNTIKSYNNYSYSKEYYKALKCIEENPDLSISKLSEKFKIKKEIIINILVNENKKEEIIIDDNFHYLTQYQKKLYNLVVQRKYSITKISKLLNSKKSVITIQLKEIYDIIKQ